MESADIVEKKLKKLRSHEVFRSEVALYVKYTKHFIVLFHMQCILWALGASTNPTSKIFDYTEYALTRAKLYLRFKKEFGFEK